MLRRASATTPGAAGMSSKQPQQHHTPPTNAGVPPLMIRKSRLRRKTGASAILGGSPSGVGVGTGTGNSTTSAGGTSRSSRSKCRPVAMVCTFLVVLWLVAVGLFLTYLLQQQQHQQIKSSSSTSSSTASSLSSSSWWSSRSSWWSSNWSLRDFLLSQQHHSAQQQGERGALEDPTLPAAKEDELIDMRQLSFELPFDNPDGGAWKQGWDVQPRSYSKKDPLTILIVPHSHCDPGWIKTFDEYFRQQTSSIITSVITSLLKDPKRTFIWAEISYFSWWWEEQDATMRASAKKLLQNRQLEFVTGGWVQPDEANSELFAMEIQLQEGHDWIRKELGEEFIPRYSWSIDPFGYSPTMAHLLKKYGFRGMLIQRVHYAVKKELAKRKHLEFYWRQIWGGKENDIFTHVMPFFSYDVPHTCGPDPSVCCQFDFHRSPVGNGPGCPWNQSPKAINSENVRERALLALDQYVKKAALYRGNVVLIPLGDDFRYQTTREAENQFVNHQRIHDYINENVEGITIKFGTLSEYFDLTIGQFAPPVLKGSFFTYSDVNEDYWSGYFTSRVFDKALDRQLERVLYAASVLGGNKTELQDPRRALSLFQHHDGVTGTARDNVVEDYAKRMHDAIRFTQKWMAKRLRQSFPQETAAVPEVKPCIVSTAARDVGQNLCGNGMVPPQGTVLVYNPLETPQTCGAVTVLPRQLKVADLPCEEPGPVFQSRTNFVFDQETGLMKEPIREEWKVWRVHAGGAYLFFPGDLMSHNLANVQIEDGGFVIKTDNWKRTVVEKEIPTEYGGKATAIDFIFEVNLDRDNEEWLVRFDADITNGGVSHTDLNGFNFDTHRFRADLPIQSQVFPMPTLASIQDGKMRMTVMSEHAQGTASLQDGLIDVWLDRRLAQDDSRGLGQGVQDNRPTRTRLRVLLEREKYDRSGDFRITKLNRLMWQELQHPLEMFGPRSGALSPGLPKKNREAGAEADAMRQQRLTESDVMRQQRLRRQGWGGQRALMNETSRQPEFSLFSWLTKGFSGVLRRIYNFNPSEFFLGGSRLHTVYNTKVPFVFMIHKRVDYMEKAIDSLRRSDFPKARVPIIISHDGHVPEMIKFVDSIKSEFQVIQIFHPHACYDNPTSFPGNDTSLNEGYRGDTYGNHREAWVTCAKHHFTWLLKTVFEDLKIRLPDKEGQDVDTISESDLVDTFLFLEEDYIVAPTIYQAIVEGMNVMARYESRTDGGFLGIALDPTQGGAKYEPKFVKQTEWFVEGFRSGPMTLNRKDYDKLRNHAAEYCRFDDYNWDWSLVHVQTHGHMPHTMLMPARTLAKHIGVAQGMHFKKHDYSRGKKYGPELESLDTRFAGTGLHRENAKTAQLKFHPGYGGWSHPADQQHCMKLLLNRDFSMSR